MKHFIRIMIAAHDLSDSFVLNVCSSMYFFKPQKYKITIRIKMILFVTIL